MCALDKSLRRVFRFYCAKHAGEQAGQNVSGGGEKAYHSLADTPSAPRLNFVTQNGGPVVANVLAYVDRGRIPQGQRFLSVYAATGGKIQASITDRHDTRQEATVAARTTDQFAESYMGANVPARGKKPFEMMVALTEKAQEWMMERVKLIRESDEGKPPPQVRAMLENLRAHANQPNNTRCDFLPGATTAKVYPNLRKGSMCVVVDLAQRTCSCGMTALTGFPCYCIAVAAKAKGTPLESLLEVPDTFAYWKRQYRFDFAAATLSTENVYAGEASELRLPVALPRPAGRPRSKRYQSSMEQGKAKAQKKVYNCKACGLPKKGHTCTGGCAPAGPSSAAGGGGAGSSSAPGGGN